MSFHLPKLKPSPYNLKPTGGFTLLEMMVVIAIITIMTGVLIGNLPSFRDATTLQLVAQDVAVTIRQAQVFGIGTKVQYDKSSIPQQIFPGHGIYFCDPTIADPNTCRNNFLLFADAETPPNSNANFFNSTAFVAGSDVSGWRTSCQTDTECRELYSLAGNISICALKVTNSSGVESFPTALSITFDRLYPDANIKVITTDTDFSNAKIYLQSKKDKKRRLITVYNTGGITVQSLSEVVGSPGYDNTCVP